MEPKEPMTIDEAIAMMMSENNDDSLVALSVGQYFSKKEKTPYYEITALNDDQGYEYCTLNQFSEIQLKELKKLRTKYGKDEFFRHLEEVFTDEDELWDISGGDEVTGMDLDTVHYKYRFSCYELKGDVMTKKEIQISLTDSEYKGLLMKCVSDSTMNINKLKYADRELYDTIMWKIDNTFCDDDAYFSDYPYLITMDEAKLDVEWILRENKGLHRNRGFGYMMR